MSSRPFGDPGPSGLDRPSLSPNPSYVSSITAQRDHPVHVVSDIDLQSQSPSSQERREHKAKLDKAFEAVNLNAVAVPYQSAAARSGLYVPNQSRLPRKDGAPPFQYKSYPRPEEYHFTSFESGLSPNLPVASSFFKETKSSGYNPQQLDLIKPLARIPNQEPPFESSVAARVAPPRPHRSTGEYINLDYIVPLEYSSRAPPVVLPFGQGPSAGQVYESPFLDPTQTSRARPLLFNAAEPLTSPQLVPPHIPGGYYPLTNPCLSKPKSSSPKSTPKESVWKKGFRKFSGRPVLPHRSLRARSPSGRNRSATSPFPRPRAPTPNRGRNVSEPQASVPSPNTQKQYSPRFPSEINFSKSYPEPVVGDRRSQEQVHDNVQAVPHRQLFSDTPERGGRTAAHYRLFGHGPTYSVYHNWEDIEGGAGDLCGVKSEENLDVCRFPSPERNFQERSHSRGRGRGRVRESQSDPEEDIPREEEDLVAKRKDYQARRKVARGRQARITTLVDREGPSECIIDKFIAEQRGVDSPRSYRRRVPVIEEVEESTKPPRTRELERGQKPGAVPAQAGALGNKSYVGSVADSNKPLKRKLVENIPRVELRSDNNVKDLVAKFDRARPIHKREISRINPTSSFRDEDLLVCIRSKTGTVKELPVTPENKLKIKTVLQHQGDSKESSPLFAADVCVSPLAFKKSPTPPRTNQFSPKFPFPGNVDPFRTANSLLDSFSASEDPHPKMDMLQVSSALRSSTKIKAEEDARAMQKSVIESCKKAGRDPPKYVLMELIGKGSFGRVYKGKDINTTRIVAVKIIDIDESDTLNPRLADTYSEFMKEVNALKILSESKAKNINHVIEALPVGTAMWMITEYCGGGSIATLMKPTPDGLKEKFIIPILREVAEAVKWVHQAGIIHRDLKCANILITEEGGVQLCDFGVAGITETALDKRSTFIGTFHWMAPELFRGSSYGKEVDIWAFGSMTYEMATGLPPNAMSGVSGMDLGTYLQTHIPRLEGDNYSEGLKSIVAFCLEENPNDRPAIEDVQRHNYIYNSGAKYPSSGLSDLVKAFKLWESHGGTRKSLFATGGAQGPSELSSTALSDDNWNFSTTPAFDLAVAQASNPEDIINVYGVKVALSTDFGDETSRPNRQQQARPSRRRPPPEALAPLKAPLEKLFDPNTISNYRDNSIQHFNLQQNTASDLPLRDDSAQISIRDTLIDLDAHDVPSGLSSFAEMDTMKPARRAVQDGSGEDYESEHDFARPALSDPVDNPNRRTQDWKFPSMAPPASANPEFTRFPPLQKPNMTPAVGARPALIHHPTEPVSLPSQSSYSLAPPAPASDRMSLIDLDMSIPEPSRPSTADSAASQDNASANPFMWERHASIYNAQGHRSAREPSLYLDDSTMGLQSRAGNTIQEFNEVSDFSTSDAEGYPDDSYNGYRARHEEQGNERYYESLATGHMPGDYENTTDPSRGAWNGLNSSSAAHSAALFHPLPPPPSAAVLSGTASQAEMHTESHRMFETLRTSLETFREAYENMPTRPPKNNQTTSGDETGGSSSTHGTGSNMS